MKTKYIITILAALPIVAGVVSCKSDVETAAKPAKEILIVEGGTEVTLRSGDSVMSVPITADCAWTVESFESADAGFDGMLSVQPKRGNGNGTLVINTNQNHGVQPRLGTIILISDGGLKQKIEIKQTSGDPTMSISERSIDFAAAPTSAKQLVITSNNGWTIEMPSGVNWVHLNKTSGSAGTVTVDVTADEINTDMARSTTLNILYGTSSAQVIVRQDGMNSDNISLGVNTDQLNIEATGGEQMLRITSNSVWRAFIPSSAQSWLQIEPASGAGNGEIRVRCQPNPDTTHDRLSLIVIIAGTQNPKQCDVLIQQSVGTIQLPTLSDISLLEDHLTANDAMVFFEFRAVSDVEDYGICYSSSNRTPGVDDTVVSVGRGGHEGFVEGKLSDLTPLTSYYARGYVRYAGQVVYTPNVVAFATPEKKTEPGENDNPDPKLSRKQ